MANYVLVHGACHGGWCWQRVEPLLKEAGHRVFTPTLTGLGDRSHLLSQEIGLETHVQDLLELLHNEDLRKVILVGHSYGGTVITGVAEEASERLAHLVYLDTVLPKNGQSHFDRLPEEFFRDWLDQVESSGGGWLLHPDVLWPTLGIVKDEDITWTKPKLTPHPVHTLQEPVYLSNADAARLPRTYIECTDVPWVNPYGEEAQKMGWRLRRIATGHDAMITAPRELAALLLELA